MLYTQTLPGTSTPCTQFTLAFPLSLPWPPPAFTGTRGCLRFYLPQTPALTVLSSNCARCSQLNACLVLALHLCQAKCKPLPAQGFAYLETKVLPAGLSAKTNKQTKTTTTEKEPTKKSAKMKQGEFILCEVLGHTLGIFQP